MFFEIEIGVSTYWRAPAPPPYPLFVVLRVARGEETLEMKPWYIPLVHKDAMKKNFRIFLSIVDLHGCVEKL